MGRKDKSKQKLYGIYFTENTAGGKNEIKELKNRNKKNY